MASSKLISPTSMQTLATNAYLIRIGNIRILSLNGYAKQNQNLVIPEADRPPATASSCGLRRDANGRATAIGLIAIYPDSGNAALYYAGSYNNASMGVSGLAVGDTMDGVILWTV